MEPIAKLAHSQHLESLNVCHMHQHVNTGEVFDVFEKFAFLLN